jgi:hypothetical protein
MLKAKKEFELEAFFYTSLHDRAAIGYRQDVMRELENDGLRALLSGFSKSVYEIGKYMDTIRSSLASEDSWRNNYLTRGRMLEITQTGIANSFHAPGAGFLNDVPLGGSSRFAGYLSEYCASEAYTGLCGHVNRLRKNFLRWNTACLSRDGTIHVRKYEGQADHSRQILNAFEKFRQGEVKDYRQKLSEEPYAEHVEAAVLSLLAGLYKDIFADLNDFCSRYLHFTDETVLVFSREIQFYLSWLDFITPFRQVGLPFCYPELCDTAERLYAFDAFDLALARVEHENTVANDFMLNAPNALSWLPARIKAAKPPSPGLSARCTIWHRWVCACRAARQSYTSSTTSSPISGERKTCPR